MKRKPRAPQLGITDAEYARLLFAQGGHCAICPNVPRKRRLHADHLHLPGGKIGPVRGLLCYRCNRFLHSWMTARWLANALDYVHRGEQAALASTDEVVQDEAS